MSNWEFGIDRHDYDDLPPLAVESEQVAREQVQLAWDQGASDYFVVRRRPAGPWEVAPDATE